MKRICFFSGDISRGGGTEKVCLLLANELCNAGYEVSIVSYNKGLNTTFKCDKKIKLFSLNIQNVTGFISRKIKPYIELKKFLKQHPQDVIINVDIILCLYSIPMKLFYNIKNIGWEHFNFRVNNGTKNRDIARKIAAKYSDYIVVLTKADLKEYKEKLKLRTPIINVYNPSVETEIEKVEKKNYIMASGRLSYQKNFQELISIWGEIKDKVKDWELIILGSGEEEEKLKSIIKQDNIENIKMMGYCKDIDKYYAQSKLFVMTSRFEGFPMVLLEAQKYGLPIIAYDCFTGPSEIVINDRNGYLIPYDDKTKFKEAIVDLINSEEKIRIMSDNAKNDSYRFNLNDFVSKWINILDNMGIGEQK